QQRAESLAAALGIGEATHHELLLVHALELQPVGRTPVHVGTVGPLGDDPLPSLPVRLPVEALPFGLPMLGEPHRIPERQQPAEDSLAIARVSSVRSWRSTYRTSKVQEH